MENTLKDLQEFISWVCTEKMNIDLPEKIEATKPIAEAFALDSISMYELIMNLEEKYNFKVEDEHITKIGTMSLEALNAFINEMTVVA